VLWVIIIRPTVAAIPPEIEVVVIIQNLLNSTATTPITTPATTPAIKQMIVELIIRVAR